MGRRSGNRGQQPIKGFRPGKEPPHLRKQRARARLGKDASWAQKQMVEAIGDRSPGEVQGMVKRWTLVLMIVTLVLLLAGLFLYTVSVVAGVLVHVLAVVAGVLWIRVRRQRDQVIALAESLGGAGGGSRKK